MPHTHVPQFALSLTARIVHSLLYKTQERCCTAPRMKSKHRNWHIRSYTYLPRAARFLLFIQPQHTIFMMNFSLNHAFSSLRPLNMLFYVPRTQRPYPTHFCLISARLLLLLSLDISSAKKTFLTSVWVMCPSQRWCHSLCTSLISALFSVPQALFVVAHPSTWQMVGVR